MKTKNKKILKAIVSILNLKTQTPNPCQTTKRSDNKHITHIKYRIKCKKNRQYCPILLHIFPHIIPFIQIRKRSSP